MFVWLGVALFIDGVDGTFARRLRVSEVLPRWSGDVLDLVVDILTYVFVPGYALAASGLLPNAAAIPLGIAVVVTGSLYFADRLMKTSDYYFRGFPALWNVAAFYLFLAQARAVARCGIDCSTGGADFCADFTSCIRSASLIGAGSRWRRSPFGGCLPFLPWREISSPVFGSSRVCAFWRFIS